MFYVKERISDIVEISVEINDENVFGTCTKCGCEVKVDLAEVLGHGEGDLFGTTVYCNDCGKKIRAGQGAEYNGHQ